MLDLSQVFAGWRRQPTADGVLLVPGDTEPTRIRVREKVPLRRFRHIVDDIRREAGSPFAQASTSPLDRFVTVEGEYAGVTTLTAGLGGGGAVEATVALIAGDDHGTVISGVTAASTRRAQCRALVRQLAERTFLGLGVLRRRRYRHASPPGWLGVRRPHQTVYMPPDYPQRGMLISVHDARPREGGAPEVEDRSLFIDNAALTDGSFEHVATGSGGLTGRFLLGTVTEAGRPLHVLRATLADTRFVYPSQLAVGVDLEGEGKAIYRALLESIEPIPQPTAPSALAIVHWLD
jgi:hypothetical protein